MRKSALADDFARRNLPARDRMPDQSGVAKIGEMPAQLNCVEALLDRRVAEGAGDRTAIIAPTVRWTYAQLLDRANRIAGVLRGDLGLVPGNRVLLRAPNTPMLAACWLAVIKAGGIAVTTMPLLRARDLEPIVTRAEIDFALCDSRLEADLRAVQQKTGKPRQILLFGADGATGEGRQLEAMMPGHSPDFANVATARDDIALIAFTSGTTGLPKGTMHYHQDVIAICRCVGEGLIKACSDDVFIGSPPLGFTFGLGMLLTMPLHVGAATVLIENATPPNLAAAIDEYRATICATAPTAYRRILEQRGAFTLSSLRAPVSAGERLPLSTFEAWHKVTGLKLIDGLGATEMLHIFVGSAGNDIRPGAIGTALNGYEVCILGENDEPLEPGQMGRLAVKGPTGCKYLADERQAKYVLNGWNITGDSCVLDEDGYVWYHGRVDDMIISAGYNISPHEVEEVLMTHPAVAECAVVAEPDPERGFIVKAFIVPRPEFASGEALRQKIQNHAKDCIAPYKYPRAIEFVEALPKTQTGKLQRQRLRGRWPDNRP